MRVSDLRELIPADHTLHEHQQQNLSSLLNLSRSFGNDAGLPPGNSLSVQEDTVVLESGHQPNFFPYSGVWKKVFLLDRFREMLENDGMHGIALFGFADQNATTAPYLYKNQVPALNKNGKQKIGFSVKGTDKWKRFDSIPKPLPEVWEEEMQTLENFYAGGISKNPEISDIMWKSYEHANSFSDLNAYIFSRISRDILGCDVTFFRYSDLSRTQLFSNECRQILCNLDRYNSVYNTAIKNNHLPSRPVDSGEVPLWYHCACGGKIPLRMDSQGVCTGTCPICNNEYELDFSTDFSRLEPYFRDMSLSAVCRNLVFAEGLGTHIFISGTGGGLSYGKISNEISQAFGHHQPVTCSWSSRDYYLGKAHKTALRELQNTFSLAPGELLDSALDERIAEVQEEMRRTIAEKEAHGAGKKTLRLYTGRLVGSAKTADMVSRVFSTVPSMFDVFMNLPGKDILTSWRRALDTSVPDRNGTDCTIAEDVVYAVDMLAGYSPEEIPVIYRNVSAIRGQRI